MENEEKREGMTVGEVMRILGRKIWYILGAAVLFAVVVVLLLEFVVDPLLATYTMDFRLVFPKEGDASYPDGSPFFWQDIISSAFLSEAKSSNQKFSSVDTEKMLKNGDIEIEAETVTEDGVIAYTGRYTVTVQGAYFRNDDQAEEFIEALANVPVARIRKNAENVDYASSSKTFESAPYEERISLLAQEKANLLSVYDGWIEVYSETYIVRYSTENGPVARRLKDFRDSVAALFGDSVREELENDLKFGGYYFCSSEEELNAHIQRLKLEYARNEAEIEQIRGILTIGGSSILRVASPYAGTEGTASQQSGLSERLAELITRNNLIDNWVNASGNVQSPSLTKESCDAFEERLSAEFVRLNEEAALLTNVTEAIYARGMSVRFDKQKVTSSGSIGILIGGIGSFVGGLIIASVVVYVIQVNRKKRSAPSPDSPSEEQER